MEKDRILGILAALPEATPGALTDDDRAEEYDDGGAHIRAARQYLPVNNVETEHFSVRVSGPKAERNRVMAEFKDALGDPKEKGTIKGKNGEVNVASWLVAVSLSTETEA